MLKVKANYFIKAIEDLFDDLQKNAKSIDNTFYASDLPFTKSHKIGISEEGFPMFFIKSSLMGDQPHINLNLITVLYSQICRLKINNTSQENYYTIVKLKSNDSEYSQYFIEVVTLILIKIGDYPKPQQLNNELKTLINLFRLFSTKPVNSIQGLWSELFVIEQSSNPSYLLHSWHKTITDIFDFNDGFNKIEVKSTIKNKRIHHFSLEQLNPNENSKLVICSIMLSPTSQGISILDLKNKIENRLSIDERIRLNEVIIQTLGSDFDKISDVYFDYQKAIDNYKQFNYKDIPSIEVENLPCEISNLHYDCDLTNVKVINKNFLESVDLFKCLDHN